MGLDSWMPGQQQDWGRKSASTHQFAIVAVGGQGLEHTGERDLIQKSSLVADLNGNDDCDLGRNWILQIS